MFEEITRKMNQFWNDDKTFAQTDPEYIDMFSAFAFDEVVHDPGAQDEALDDRRRSIAIAAALIGANGLKAFTSMMPAWFNAGLSARELKEIVYQATAYVGFGQAVPFLEKANDYLKAVNVRLPLPSGRATDGTLGDRLAKGERAQMEAFGDAMAGYADAGDGETGHINRWLVANCFGDYYTRDGLGIEDRELATFCMLAGLGCADPQLKAHVGANVHVGNGRHFLIAAASQIMPYIGYPKTLNAISAIKEAAPQE